MTDPDTWDTKERDVADSILEYHGRRFSIVFGCDGCLRRKEALKRLITHLITRWKER